MKTIQKLILVSIALFSGITMSFGQFSNKVANLPSYNYAPIHVGFSLSYAHVGYAVTMKPGAFEQVFSGSMMPSLGTGVHSNGYPDAMQLLSVTSKPAPGFFINFVSDARISNYFNLRFTPGLLLTGDKGITYTFQEIYHNPNPDPQKLPKTVEVLKKVRSTYLEFPLAIKYRSVRMHNLASYVTAGGKYSYDFGRSRKQQSDEYGQDKHLIINNHNFSLEAAVGFEYYTRYFKFGTEFKASYGMNNLLDDNSTAYSMGIDSIRSKTFFVVFTFE